MVNAKPFLWDWIAGTTVAVLWTNLSSFAYGDGCSESNCWPFVGITFVASVVSTFLFPMGTYLAMVFLSSTKKKSTASALKQRQRLLMDTEDLLASGFGTCVSVSYTTCAYYLYAEVLYTIQGVSVAERSEGRGPGAPPKATSSPLVKSTSRSLLLLQGMPPPVGIPPPGPNASATIIIKNSSVFLHNSINIIKNVTNTGMASSTSQATEVILATLGIALSLTALATVLLWYTRRTLQGHYQRQEPKQTKRTMPEFSSSSSSGDSSGSGKLNLALATDAGKAEEERGGGAADEIATHVPRLSYWVFLCKSFSESWDEVRGWVLVWGGDGWWCVGG